MSTKAPYQPSLLRLLHGVSALCMLGAVISGYWTYNQFDGRWVRIDLPHLDSIMHWHHEIAGKAMLVFLLLILYSLTLGRRKLVQPSSLKHLTQVNTPLWWQSLHRLTNTFLLGGMALAVLSGRQMNGSWLVQGDFAHGTYIVHLAAWAAIGLGFILHMLMNLKIGGIPMLLSIFAIKIRPNDTPKHWFSQIQKIWKRH
jgi:Prokaryotic cytochrome b561